MDIECLYYLQSWQHSVRYDVSCPVCAARSVKSVAGNVLQLPIRRRAEYGNDTISINELITEVLPDPDHVIDWRHTDISGCDVFSCGGKGGYARQSLGGIKQSLCIQLKRSNWGDRMAVKVRCATILSVVFRCANFAVDLALEASM